MKGYRGAADAKIEHSLALAWRHVYSAARMAEIKRSQGLCDDLYQIAEEIRRVQEDLLKRGRALKTRAPDRAYLYPRLTDDRRPAS